MTNLLHNTVILLSYFVWGELGQLPQYGNTREIMHCTITAVGPGETSEQVRLVCIYYIFDWLNDYFREEINQSSYLFGPSTILCVWFLVILILLFNTSLFIHDSIEIIAW